MINWGGTTYSIHPLFVMLLALSAITGHILELVTLFVIVIVHEMGHVLTAKAFGWSIEEVKLLPFGGVAETKDGAVAPGWQECIVAAAGPLQNGIMIVIALWFAHMGIWSLEWANYFIEANMLIACFNLLPILPLDGGRMLQASCGRLVSYHRMLIMGVWFSLVSSTLLGIFALLPLFNKEPLHLNMLVLSIFLAWSNWVERKHIPYRFVRFLVNRPKRLRRWEQEIHLGQPIITEADRPVSAILKRFRRDMYHLIYIMGQNGRIEKIIPEQQLIDAYFDDPNSSPEQSQKPTKR
ncbi:MAG: M50 family metallopeptidase [Paenibacillus sp.]|uniref:Stage IV sporulation protein FB n=1 Tax=Paenibacillus aquistagni TaxID=1852522 RepID=A0A1X7LVZ1_9BACL|nr:M50 family metallopeptidase [Paenibacillus aquistagni]MBR2569926.1 M50 family metallopeptidase [Paenibacillus sp.]SMG58058.1 stage IV sporulation protein FB [Paenibacillus aquistagni]